MPTKSSKSTKSKTSRKRTKKIVPFELQNIKPTEFQGLLEKLGACESARTWAKGKSFKRVFNTCPKYSWLAWLFNRTTGLINGYSWATGLTYTATRKESLAWGGKTRAGKAYQKARDVVYTNGSFSDGADAFRKYYTVV
jgi:hypothetical protein